MKKIILLIIILSIILTPLTVLAGTDGKKTLPRPIKYEYYGMVYLFVEDAPLYYFVISHVSSDEVLYLACKPIVLTNKGIVVTIEITCPLEESYVMIFDYPNGLYCFHLKLYKVYDNLIVWTFGN